MSRRACRDIALRQSMDCVCVLQVCSGQGLVIVQHFPPHLMHQRAHKREEIHVHGLDESHNIGDQTPGPWQHRHRGRHRHVRVSGSYSPPNCTNWDLLNIFNATCLMPHLPPGLGQIHLGLHSTRSAQLLSPT